MVFLFISVSCEYSCYRNDDFKEGHAFIGYQKDTPAAVVFQASRQLKRLRKGHRRLESMKEYSIFRHISLEELANEEKGSDLWKLAVSVFCSSCLMVLVCCTNFVML